MSKQSNERFSKLIEYIETNLYEEIDYRRMSEILGVNEYTMHRSFLFITDYTNRLNDTDYISGKIGLYLFILLGILVEQEVLWENEEREV